MSCKPRKASFPIPATSLASSLAPALDFRYHKLTLNDPGKFFSAGALDLEDGSGPPAASARGAELTPAGTPRARRGVWERYAPFAWLLGPWLLGAALGFLQDTEGEPCTGLPPAVERLSTVLGWVYFSAWSVSFYPQLWLNYWRRSVVGLSLDFQIFNMLGFVCYSIYNGALFWSHSIREEYAGQHSGAVPAVHTNDVFFAIHAALLTGITLAQCCLYNRGGQVPSRISVVGTTAVVAVAVALAGAVAISEACGEGCEHALWLRHLTWLDWLYFLSFVKLGVSIVKYIPQAMLNYRRQSTAGWNVWNVLLDLEGGFLSLTQLLMDSGVTHDFSPVVGNPVKFGLSIVTMCFDAVFILQHFVLYRESRFSSPPPGLPPQEWGNSPCASGASPAGTEGGEAAAAGSPRQEVQLASWALQPLVPEPPASSPSKQRAAEEGQLASEGPGDERAALLPGEGR